jgi:hypothetical protein
MITKLQGLKYGDDFTLLGECFSVEIEHLGDDDVHEEDRPAGGRVTLPTGPVVPDGTVYRQISNAIHTDGRWKRMTLTDVRGHSFMIVDFDGTAYVMNDSGKTIEIVH